MVSSSPSVIYVTCGRGVGYCIQQQVFDAIDRRDNISHEIRGIQSEKSDQYDLYALCDQVGYRAIRSACRDLIGPGKKVDHDAGVNNRTDARDDLA